MPTEAGQEDLLGVTDAETVLESGKPSRVSASEAQRSVDDLVGQAMRYRGSREFVGLLRFAGRFRTYSPFNCLLIHAQLTGAQFVAPAHRWEVHYGRRVLPGQQPVVILQPFGPVMFVYDVAQTEQIPGRREIPLGVNPFSMPAVVGVGPALADSVTNAMSDGVRVHLAAAGSHSAGCIWRSSGGAGQEVQIGRRPPRFTTVPVRYECEVNRFFSPTEQYATLAHELAHLYCGHVGTHNPKWWPDRGRTDRVVAEFEAESAAYIACRRLDGAVQMPPHLGQYLEDNATVPDGVSLSRIMVSAERVIEMGKGWLPPRRTS